MRGAQQLFFPVVDVPEGSSGGILRHRRAVGFTLLELLIALAFLAILGTLTLVATSMMGSRLADLRGDRARLLSLLDRARFGALTEASQWMMMIDCDLGKVAIGPDDGWLGTYTAPTRGVAMRRDYYSGSPDFSEAQRRDGVLQGVERVAEMSLHPTVRFLHDPPNGYECPGSIAFAVDANIGSLRILWLADDSFSTSLSRSSQKGLVRPIVVLPSGAVHLAE